MILDKYKLPTDFLLYVGAINPRKNLLTIVKTLQQLPDSLSIPLVVVGSGRQYEKKVKQYVFKNSLQNRIHWLGQADQKDMPALYQAATLFLYPSHYEGFGIPIIEALFSETPVITSNCSSMPEAAGPDALLIDPKQPEDLAQAIDKVLSDDALRERMIKKGYAYAQQFKGEPLTKQLVEIYQSVL